MAPVCISDSRGRYLGDSLSNVLYKGEHLYSFFHPGAKLTNLKDKVEDLIQEMPVTSLYIMAGVNDITTRGRNSLYLAIGGSCYQSGSCHYLGKYFAVCCFILSLTKGVVPAAKQQQQQIQQC